MYEFLWGRPWFYWLCIDYTRFSSSSSSFPLPLACFVLFLTSQACHQGTLALQYQNKVLVLQSDSMINYWLLLNHFNNKCFKIWQFQNSIYSGISLLPPLNLRRSKLQEKIEKQGNGIYYKRQEKENSTVTALLSLTECSL